jgi:hypothetical protein
LPVRSPDAGVVREASGSRIAGRFRKCPLGGSGVAHMDRPRGSERNGLGRFLPPPGPRRNDGKQLGAGRDDPDHSASRPGAQGRHDAASPKTAPPSPGRAASSECRGPGNDHVRRLKPTVHRPPLPIHADHRREDPARVRNPQNRRQRSGAAGAQAERELPAAAAEPKPPLRPGDHRAAADQPPPTPSLSAPQVPSQPRRRCP